MKPESTEVATTRTVDRYIAGFPDDVQEKLNALRATIQQTEPEAEETIKYNMPTYTLHGRNLVYFAAWKRHIAFYPTPSEDAELNAETGPYQSGKGTLKFPLASPLPLDLIRRVVLYWASKNRAS
jgi:uncharacterized protein YdhG (YjbR/CyaY superfamily)